jgi:Uma2 family endonuclease
MWDPALTQRGTLFEMTPRGAHHSLAVTLLADALRTRLQKVHPGAFLAPTHSPLALSQTSEPEPDIAVIDLVSFADAQRGHPSSAHLLVEVAQSSQRADLLHKPRIYAGAEIPHYWVLDLISRRAVVHQQPEAGTMPSIVAWSNRAGMFRSPR